MNKKGLIKKLRQNMQALEGGLSPKQPKGWTFGARPIDSYFPMNGLAGDGVHDVVWGHLSDYCTGLGFILSLYMRNASGRPILHCTSQAELIPYYQGLEALGLHTPQDLIHLKVESSKDILWAAEEALRHGSLGAVIAETSADLNQSRRLHLAAQEGGTPCFLLHHEKKSALNGAHSRWHVRHAPHLLGYAPKWRLDLTRNKNGRLGHWTVEWHHETRHFHISPSLADRAMATGQGPYSQEQRASACA